MSEAGTDVRRLSFATLSMLRPDMAPPYERDGPAPIVHLGVGAFARAHLGTFADDLLRNGIAAMVRGVSLNSQTAERQLQPQDCLFTVTELEPGLSAEPRLMGSFASVRTGIASAIEAIDDRSTALVTMTVTEKGYDLDPADLDSGNDPRSLPAVIAHALVRRDRSTPAPVFAPLDNLPTNGTRLRSRVLEVASILDIDAARWIADEVHFTNSVVDRVVPATSPGDLTDTADRLGMTDLAAVVCERHRSWIIEEVPGLPPLAAAGVQIVADIEPFQDRKLWLLNGPHSTIAYCGLLTSHETIAGALKDPAVMDFVRLVVDDIVDVATLPTKLDSRRFADEALRRFANPTLAHRCAQVAADGSKKIPQRLLPVVQRRRAVGLPTDRLALVVGIWLAAVCEFKLPGVMLPLIEDPGAALARDLGRSVHPVDAVRALFGSSIDEQFAQEIGAAVDNLTNRGPGALRVGQ